MTALAPWGWRAWTRRHERLLAAAWLTALAVLLTTLALPPARRAVLRSVQALTDRWDARWTARLARGDSLVAAGRFSDAAIYLERLDRVFPARNARHVRDKEREHLLDLLARSYEAQGKSGKAMGAYDRLVSFDSLNYYNHFLRARAAERLLSGWAIAPEARDGFAGALHLFPSHLPSVRGYIQYFADRSDWRPVIEAYEAYLGAFLVQGLTVRTGPRSVTVMVPVDGRPHAVTVALDGADSIQVAASGFAFALDSAAVTPWLRVGEGAAGGARAVATAGTLRGMVRDERGALRPVADSAAITLALPPGPGGGGELRLVVRLFKPVDRTLWATVATSYRNLLEFGRRDDAAARTVPFPSAAAADAALERLPSARAGLPPAPRAP